MSILGTKWDQTWTIIVRAVRRGKKRKLIEMIPHFGIDEKAFKKGHRYLTLLYDLNNSTVEAISEGNDASKACFSTLSDEQIGSVKGITMDMGAAYVKASKETIPLAEEKIFHDRS